MIAVACTTFMLATGTTPDVSPQMLCDAHRDSSYSAISRDTMRSVTHWVGCRRRGYLAAHARCDQMAAFRNAEYALRQPNGTVAFFCIVVGEVGQ